MSLSSLRIVALTASAAFLSSSSASAAPGGSACSLASGQKKIDQGQYEQAITIYTCVLEKDPLVVDAYRGRSEAKLLLGDFADAYHEYHLIIARTQPEDIDDLADEVLAGYDKRLHSPTMAAMTGASFALWVFWQYPDAVELIDDLLAADPDNVYGHLFRGSSMLFAGMDTGPAEDALDEAIALAPDSADVRFFVADAYTYALPDYDRAWDEAVLAYDLGLDTPRVHAILATILNDDGELLAAAEHIQTHIDMVTTDVVATAALGVDDEVEIGLWPGRTHEIPIQVAAGEAIVLQTSSPSSQIWDSIMVLLAPDGSPVVGSDDTLVDYFAALDWVAPVGGTYTLRVTSFEAISTGPLVVARQ